MFGVNALSNKGWTALQICSGAAIVVIMILGFTVFGEQQSDGSFVAKRTPLTVFLGLLLPFFGLFVILAEVRKRTGELSVRTFLLAALWFGGIALLLTLMSLFRN